MQENALSSGKYYTAGKDFTRRVSRDKSHLSSLHHYLELSYHFSISTSSYHLGLLSFLPNCVDYYLILVCGSPPCEDPTHSLDTLAF